jgi:hypothetical protein
MLHLTGGKQLVRNPLGGFNGHGKAQTLGIGPDGGIHADHLPPIGQGQGTAGIPRIDGRVGLDKLAPALSGIPTSLLVRPRALMMPAVTVLSRPRGLPMAIAHCPGARLSVLPNRTIGRLAASIFTTATSVTESTPTT